MSSRELEETQEPLKFTDLSDQLKALKLLKD